VELALIAIEHQWQEVFVTRPHRELLCSVAAVTGVEKSNSVNPFERAFIVRCGAVA
jgi:hypothetical protein